VNTRQAEVKCAHLYRMTNKPRSKLGRRLTIWKPDAQFDESVFNEFIGRTGGLCAIWTVFCSEAERQGLTWQAALQLVMPGYLRQDANGAVTIPEDSVLAYAFATSDPERAVEFITESFQWRLGRGFC
jgi:hypothetical protein